MKKFKQLTTLIKEEDVTDAIDFLSDLYNKPIYFFREECGTKDFYIGGWWDTITGADLNEFLFGKYNEMNEIYYYESSTYHPLKSITECMSKLSEGAIIHAEEKGDETISLIFLSFNKYDILAHVKRRIEKRMSNITKEFAQLP